jgi:hypothetical protein
VSTSLLCGDIDLLFVERGERLLHARFVGPTTRRNPKTWERALGAVVDQIKTPGTVVAFSQAKSRA